MSEEIHKFPTRIKFWKHEIGRLASRDGLDYYPVIFEMVTYDEMSELAAYVGYPVRYHHWRFGQNSLRMKRSYRHGMHVIYEMVIATNPAYAYLLDVNEEVQQKAVMAHVFGHVDFFKNNAWFSDVPTNMHNRFADHSTVLDEIRSEIGKETVDEFLEACLSLENLFDLLGSVIQREPDIPDPSKQGEKRHPQRIESRDKLPSYMDDVLNPPEWLEERRREIEEEDRLAEEIVRGWKIPAAPVRNVFGFLLRYANLKMWQQRVLQIVAYESYGLVLGGQTKTMNEGWAAYWEARIMIGDNVAGDAEMCPFALSYARILGGDPLNPYKLGKKLWDDIQFRWDTARHGTLWNTCTFRSVKDRWDEFIVFKYLFEKHGEMNESFWIEWDEFSTFVHELMEDRGPLRQIYVQSRNIVPHWCHYLDAFVTRDAFEDARERTQHLDAEIAEELPDVEDPSIERFKLQHQKLQELSDANDPFHLWTHEELGWEQHYREWCYKFRARLRDGSLNPVRISIPDEWILWARKIPGQVELGAGLEKMFEVRQTHNDTSFIQEFFTPEFCEEEQFFLVGITKQPEWYGEDHYTVSSRNYQRVKDFILERMLNIGQPKIEIIDGNFNNNRELVLRHLHDGRDLDEKDLKETLKRLYVVWGDQKPVHIDTIITTWPERRSPWDLWVPPGTSPLPSQEVKREVVRYTCKNGKMVERTLVEEPYYQPNLGDYAV